MRFRNLYSSVFIAAVTAYGGVAVAQDNGDELESTMNMVEETGQPAETLTLPEDAAPQGVENSADGLSTANEARELGREFGENRAAEARELGEQARGSARDSATDARAAADAARERAAEAGANRR